MRSTTRLGQRRSAAPVATTAPAPRDQATTRPSGATSGFPSQAARPGDLAQLQRQAGNAAVIGLVTTWQNPIPPRPAPAAAQAPVVQRLGVTAALSVLVDWAGLDINPIAIAASLIAGEDAEMVLLNVLVANGMTDKDRLASAVFYARHPERVFTPLTKDDKALAAEWKKIKATKVKAALKPKKNKHGGFVAAKHVAGAPVAELDADAMAAALTNPHVVVVTEAVKKMDDKAVELAKPYGEERGPVRDALVGEIHTVRGLIVGLDGAGLPAAQLEAVKAHFYRKVNAVSPFYEQDPNMNLLEGEATRTCGITSFGMALEAMGKTAADYTGPSVANVAKVYGGKVDSAKDDQGGGMTGLRLPDFIQLVAIAKCGGAAGDVQAAMEIAWKKIKSLNFIADMARDFGVPSQVGTMKTQHGSKAGELRTKAESLHKKRVERDKAKVKLKDLGESADPKSLKARAKLEATIRSYEATMATMHEGLSPEYLDKLITVESFRTQVLATIKPELDRGRQVINNMTKHYVRVESVTDDGMVSDDPGGSQRKDRPVSWEEGRAMAFFHDYLVLG